MMGFPELPLGCMLLLLSLHVCVLSSGSMPDASQEGVLKQFRSYEDVALFHYTVPPEATRATWEFASFQDESSCPSREVMIYIQHGSFPVMSADNSSFPSDMLGDRTSLHLIKTHSAFQPHDSTIFPVYNPLPGTWFAAAYLSPFEEKIIQQGIHHKCRYSLGSIALWHKADQVENIIPFLKKSYTTKKHFSYYKFFIPDNINSFTLTISGCVIKSKTNSNLFSGGKMCIEYANIRAKALPKHNPDTGGLKNIPELGTPVNFVENRPFKEHFYYLLIVSSAQAAFDLSLNYTDCGESGIYGKEQNNWYLAHEGLKYNATNGYMEPKEPKSGFQLFTVYDKVSDQEPNFDFGPPLPEEDENPSQSKVCRSTFDFSRVDNVEEFSSNFFLQGKAWYTRWVTVTNRFPILTRFRTLDFSDLGGTVNIALGLDTFDPGEQTVEVYGCLSKDREPEEKNSSLSCEDEYMLRLASDEPPRTASKMLPFPEPGVWYLGLQVRCLNPDTRESVQCWGDFRFANLMTSINIHIQPCGYRSQKQICGKNGVCVRTHKGVYMYTSCRCSSGFRGWTCDDQELADPHWKLISDTLLLTLSNLFFLPAIILAIIYRLYTEALIYFATMFFSTFYHICDQEMSHLPYAMEQACRALYVKKEVFQFCDFFCAILSFWVTIISMAKLPDKLVSFLHMFGVLLVSILVQYNRNGIQVFAVPIPLGLLVLIVTLSIRSFKRRKILKANRSCALWFTLGILCACTAVLIFALIETTANYQYVHSGWHIMIALSLVFLLPYCRPIEKSFVVTGGVRIQTDRMPKSESLTSEESELQEVDIGPWIDSSNTNADVQPELYQQLSEDSGVSFSNEENASKSRRTLIQTVPSLSSQLATSSRTIQTVPSLTGRISQYLEGLGERNDSHC